MYEMHRGFQDINIIIHCHTLIKYLLLFYVIFFMVTYSFWVEVKFQNSQDLSFLIST